VSRDVWLVGADGRRTADTLDEQIGSVGSQGAVWTLRGRPGAVAKVVHQAGTGDLVRRVRAMLAEPADWTVRDGRPIVAWPVAAVHRRADDRLLGYAAPRLAPPRFAPLPVLFNPSARRRMLPAATWSWWLTVAEELARAVHVVHQRGHVIGDLAPANLFAGASGAVCLIDADGWQLHDLPCPFSRPEYTPPEYLGAAPGHRDPAGDHWALAVIVAQLLSLGFHPYGGVPRDASGPVEEIDNVRARRCRLLGADVRTPAAAPPAALFSGVLRQRLSEALDAGHHDPGVRPGPLAWAAALAYTRRRLVTCPASPAHRHSPELPRCPWCAMVAAGARDPFPVAAGSGAAGSGGPR
jgi:DNA-binding helix-hairpin-helix protein with protein kinase domain